MATHPADCLCPTCCMRDMDEHLTSMGLNPADFPIAGKTAPAWMTSGKGSAGKAVKSGASLKQIYWIHTMGQTKNLAGASKRVLNTIAEAGKTPDVERLTRDSVGKSTTVTPSAASATLDFLFAAPYKK